VIDSGKYNVLGILVNAIDYEAVVGQIMSAAQAGKPLAVSAVAVHGIMSGFLDARQKYRLNSLDFIVPDGQPVRWALQWLHNSRLRDRVYGPRLMQAICAEAARQKMPIYLYGSTKAVVMKLATQLDKNFHGIRIAGAESSKFRTLDAHEREELVAKIGHSGARLVFVGLGCPRQEAWAYELRDKLPMPIIAVGAAFPLLAGVSRQAPAWMQQYGFEWLFRLLSEPRRLWKRYLCLNPLFLGSVALQCAGLRFSACGRRPSSELRYG